MTAARQRLKQPTALITAQCSQKDAVPTTALTMQALYALQVNLSAARDLSRANAWVLGESLPERNAAALWRVNRRGPNFPLIPKS